MRVRLMPSISLFVVTWLAAATAQTYPTRPIKLIVGYTPGGASDVVGRIVGSQLAALNGQSVIVENHPGVGGILGMSLVAKSPPDGYTLGVAVSGTMVTGPHLQKNMPYDPLNAFAPVGLVASAPMVMLVPPDAPNDTVAGLVAAAKADPGKLMFASGAQAFELAMRLFDAKAGVSIGSVSYPGGGQAALDVMAGRVPIMIDTIGAQKANIAAGKLKAVAVLDSKRSTILPNVPTVAESGVPGYEAVGWLAIVAPKGTPQDVVDKLNGQLRQILALPQVNERLATLGFEPSTDSPAEFGELVRTEYAKWGDVVKSAGLAAQ